MAANVQTECPRGALAVMSEEWKKRCPFVKLEALDVMAWHYIVAMAWANGLTARPTAQAWRAAAEQCAAFLQFIGEADCARLAGECFDNGYGKHPDCGARYGWAAALGHDFYLDRAGAGVGFWCRDELPEDLQTKLSDACGWRKQFAEPEHTTARGWLYIER